MPLRLLVLAAALVLGAAAPALAARPIPAYQPIVPKPGAEAQTVVLTGHDLTIESVLAVARDGAKVRFSPEAIAQAEAGQALLAQGNAQGVSMYTVNRGAGALREQRVTRPEGGNLDGAKAGARAPGGLPRSTRRCWCAPSWSSRPTTFPTTRPTANTWRPSPAC